MRKDIFFFKSYSDAVCVANELNKTIGVKVYVLKKARGKYFLSVAESSALNINSIWQNLPDDVKTSVDC